MFKIGECNSIKHNFHKPTNIYPNISNEQQFRLNKIKEIKDYFLAEIRGGELIRKILVNIFLLLTFYISRHHFYCIICNCYWSTCRTN